MFVRNFIVIAFLVMTIFSVITIAYSNRMKESAKNEVIENNYQELRRNAELLDSMIKQLKDCAYHLSKAEELNMLNTFEKNDVGESYILSLKEKISIYSRIYEYVDSIFVYMEKQQFTLGSNGKIKLADMLDTDWLTLYDITPEIKGKQTCVMAARSKFDGYPCYMTIVYALYNGQNEKSGAIVINLDMNELSDVIDIDDSREQLYMIDAEKQLIYASQEKVIESPELLPEDFDEVCEKCFDGEKMESEHEGTFVHFIKSKATNGYYIFYRTDEYYKERIELTTTYVKQNMT